MSDLQQGIEEILASGRGEPTVARDPVNQPMIHHWTDAIGDKNPIYVDDDAARAAGHDGIVAPPAMIQVWTMMGLGRARSDDDPLARAMKLFDDAGYVGVVATNCDQTYHRYLRPGEQVAMSAEIVSIIGPKQTALGEGYFINQKIRWHVGAEEVADMDWRIMKFLPAAKQAQPEAAVIPEDLDPDKLMRPASSRDTKFFWDGINAHELRIQRRPDGTLQHPPVPAVWADKDAPVDYVVSSGNGTVYSYVVHHAPKVPGRSLPFVIALVELEEGVRMLGELRGLEPDQVKIGLPVRATYLDFPDSDVSPAWSLYAWEPQA
ncbi:bifunctional MaoC family dehydratase N-terminal/OB-fold nucleic acid binding domain-containing protein [Mycolicibacterium sp. J2]|uniref:bifunctional MaoC family dehydratase N-terminal/OB-fold nucleic acid binding domain-containing protein n=1 Tax=Mycolicibacterium sp. J2 TaxID=2993511 RepID=UPI00224A8CD4|nr:bifunctional MaoC family dehydratase N-terminal/OB-fold nucleic acid binding domain-containing protein [Mycolicibacterium sp. J2]MCX2712376.1 bifunctional MaoC family dehydratase N-terminal/OB-fold nucleic acid binding domain-containing protein [Mycolicibacterium sp. J2]